MTEQSLTMVEPCKSCEHRTKFKTYWVCGCQCGRATANSGHPLAPCCIDNGECVIGPVDEYGHSIPEEITGYGFVEEYKHCEVDEYAIQEGHRCYLYIGWLEAMRKYNGDDYKYPQRFKNPIIPVDSDDD